MGVTFEQFRKMALALRWVEEYASHDATPAFRVKTKFMARLREPDVLVLKPVEDDEQHFLMDTNPGAFFLTDHHRGYPTILIRLSKVPRGQLQELLDQSWRRLAPKKLLAEHDAAAASKTPSKKTPSKRKVTR